jgi:hypothetical protein
MRSLSVELKLGAAIAAITLVAALVATQLASGAFRRSLDDAALSTVRDASRAFEAQERSEIEKLAATLDGLLGDAELRAAFLARDRERLLALARPRFRVLTERDRITHWYFIEPEPASTVFLRVHHPELHGDVVARATFRQAVQTGELGAGKELGRTAFALRAVRPWVHEGKVIGYMELAEEIDHFLTAMKVRTGDDYGLLVKKRFLDERAWADVLGPRANTWNDRPDVVVVDTTTFTEGIVDFEGDLEALPERGRTLGRVVRGDRSYVRGIFPVLDAGGRKVGGLFVLRDFTRHDAALGSARVHTLVSLVGVGVVLAFAIVLAVRRFVFARLARLRGELETRAAEVGLPPGRVVQLESEDEIGRLEALFRRVLFPSRVRDEPREPRGGARDGAGPASER